MKMSIKQLEGTWKYIPGDLTDEMVRKTIQAYDTHVIEYAEGFEWDPDMQTRTSHDYLHDFISYLKTGDHVFVAGSGTGRDALELSGRGFQVACVDASIEMLDVAVQHGIRLPMWCQDIADVRLPESSYDGVLAESVLQHVAKWKTPDLLQRMISWLRVDGEIFVRLRIGSGEIFQVEDVVGTRYFATYTAEEVNALIKKLKKVKLIEDLRLVKHKVEGRPGFGSFVLRKVSK